MSSDALLNLRRIGLLDDVPASNALIQKMLNTAQSRLQDALRFENSMETRFDCAYTAIRAVADAALLKQDFRTSTSKPGHHQTTLQCLIDYDGELITESFLTLMNTKPRLTTPP